MHNKSRVQQDISVPEPPTGVGRLKWLGPAFIWMLSAAGSGELLFTPRIAAQYGYTLAWALLLAVLLKWCINREIGRYTVCTGASFFRGLASISLHSRWLLWLLLVPQLLVAIATISGLAGGAATALQVLLGWPLWVSALGLISVTAVIILAGQYKAVEKVTTGLAIVISGTLITAAMAAQPDYQEMVAGLVPNVRENISVKEVLPWLGFMLAGAAGLMWFSYWTAARGYGAASLHQEEPIELSALDDRQTSRLSGWVRHMTIANTLAVVGALVIAFAFLILGTELLLPEKLVPEENKVAETLAKLLEGVWGETGFWIMILAVFVTFVSTLLADQDGFSRMFADGTALLLQGKNVSEKWKHPPFLKRWFIVLVLAVLPAAMYGLTGDPVTLLKMAGVVEACHIPVVAGLILYLNRKTLPKTLRPGWGSTLATGIAGVAFGTFAVIYIAQLIFKE